MGAYAAGWSHRRLDFGITGIVRFCKQILNAVAERAAVAADRSPFAGLPARYLDDIGMTSAERAAILGYEEPTTDGWLLVASHL